MIEIDRTDSTHQTDSAKNPPADREAACHEMLDRMADRPMTCLDLARMSREDREQWLKDNPPASAESHKWWNNPDMAWDVLEGRLSLIGSGIEAAFDLAEARSNGVLFTLRALEGQLDHLRGEIRQVLRLEPEAQQ